MNKCIIFDIDGTLADLSHRVHHVQGSRKDWPAFMAGILNDLPMEQTIWLNNVIEIYNSVGPDTIPIFIASGRSDDERSDTVAWLHRYGVVYDHLYMRKSKDYRADHIIKKEILEEIRSNGYEPWLIIDDRQQVVDMWRSEGLFVLQCDPFKNFTAHADFNFKKGIKYPLTLMVGPSGAGKSTWLKENVEQSWIISSDQIRSDLCGDFRDQSRNQEVFETLHELALTRLKRGLPVIIDATNIRDADRKAIVKLVPDDVPVKYYVINRPFAEKVKDGGWRNSVFIKGQTLIEKHDQTFKSNLKQIMKGDGLPNVTVEVL
jgi:hypothetical protein